MIRKATLDDLEMQRTIILEGKETLHQLGINMWTGDYPSEPEMKKDIEKGDAYVYCLNGKIVATFALQYGVDPVYEEIENGEWLSELPYSIIKRLSVAGNMRGKNITGKLIEAVGHMSMAKGYPSLRLDTHPDNESMKRAMEKNGYQYTGELNTDQTWHAYEKVIANEPTRIQKATLVDIPAMMVIINDAKVNLKKTGINQWQGGYPNEASLAADIETGHSYLYFENGELAAITGLFPGPDSLYSHIEEGEWITELPYTSIHRIAVAKDMLGKGVAGRLFEICELLTTTEGYKSIRIDTHPENKSMRRTLEKKNYQYCGHVFMENNDLRFAYEKPLVTDC